MADHEGRDRLGVLTLETGTVEWVAGEPDLFPHSVLAGTGDDFICVHHEQSQTRAALVGPAGIRPLPNLSGRRSLLPHAALPGGGWLAEAYDADAPHDLVAVAADGTCRVIWRAAPDPGGGMWHRRISAGPPRTAGRCRVGCTGPTGRQGA